MRRASLLALLVAPAVAVAQVTIPEGRILFDTELNSSLDEFINRAECEQDGTIRLDARIRFANGGTTFNRYQLWAANNVADPDSTDPCPTTSNQSSGLEVGLVAENTVDPATNPLILDAEFSTSRIVGAVRATCNASADLVLCIQARNGTTNVGTARARVSLVIDEPQAPELESVAAGEGALNVSWDAPNAGTNESYQVEASTDPNFAGTAPIHVSGRVSSTSLRLRGLDNNVQYSVRVFAFSDADNVSEPSNVLVGTPLPVNDFWELYQDRDGREQGGCGSGGAGLLALAGVASLLLLRRRS